MVYYTDSLSASYPGFTLNSLTAHRFLIAAATVAAKGPFSDPDPRCTTAYYARVGGVSAAELRLLQRELLSRIRWRVVLDEQLLVAYYHGLVERSARFRLAAAT
jgi:hypothetical protein